jgi:hypothetical protein
MAAVSVGTSPEQLPVDIGETPALWNNGPGIIYLGYDNTVSAGNGFPLASGSGYEFPKDLTRSLWAVATAESDLRILVVG